MKTSKHFLNSVLLLFFVLLSANSLHAAPARLAPEAVPAPLKPWIKWILAGEESALCPHIADQPRCVWTNQLVLNTSDQGAQFRLTAQVSQADWLTLPGNIEFYPINVTANGTPAPTVLHDEMPSVYLQAGTYQIAGEFRWANLPDAIPIPNQIGLIAFTHNGQAVAHPRRDSNGQLQLKNSPTEDATQTQGDALTIQVFRKIQDGIPYQIENHIQLDVSGKPRELTLPLALFVGERLHQFESDLPARLELPNVRIQLRAGRWQLRWFSHRWQHDWTLPSARAPWPAHEIWTWETDADLRTVSLQTQGTARSIDSRQTELPEAWRHLPAWRLEQVNNLANNALNGLQLTVQQRGESKHQGDELRLKRQLWLDFDGEAYTLQDAITGTIRQNWRLQAQPELKLGRVSIQDEPQFITCLSDNPSLMAKQATPTQQDCPRGVEVRRGELNLRSDSRLWSSLGDIFGLFARLPVTGWQHSFLSVENTLLLGPGWRVLGVFGVDNVPDTWFGQWNLLDLFLWLVLSLAIWKLHGKKWGILALVALAIAWHEADNFTLVGWLLLVVWMSLRRALPESWQNGRLSKGLHTAWWASMVLWSILMVTFLLPTLRLMLHPQLENGLNFDQSTEMTTMTTEAIATTEVATDAMPAAVEAEPTGSMTKKALPKSRNDSQSDSSAYWSAQKSQAIQQFDPSLRVQTGPGLPEWVNHYHKLSLRWDGMVLPEQNMYLFFSPPWLTAIWRGLSILGLLWLGIGVLGVRLPKRLVENPAES